MWLLNNTISNLHLKGGFKMWQQCSTKLNVITYVLNSKAVKITAMPDTVKYKIVASAVKSSFDIHCNRNAAALDAPYDYRTPVSVLDC